MEFSSLGGLTINRRIAATLNNHDKVLLVNILIFISINNFKMMQGRAPKSNSRQAAYSEQLPDIGILYLHIRIVGLD